MDDSDKKVFKVMLDELCDFYQRKKMTPSTMRLYFSVLSDMTIGEVRSAIESHIKNKKTGKFFPKAADLVVDYTQTEIGDLSWVGGELLESAKEFHLKKYGFYRIGKEVFRSTGFQNSIQGA